MKRLIILLMILLLLPPALVGAQHKQLVGTGSLTASTGLKISFDINAYVQGSPTQRFVRGSAMQSGKRILTVNTQTLSMTWNDSNDTLTVECQGVWQGAKATVRYIAVRKPDDFFHSHIRIEVRPIGGGLWSAEGSPALLWVDVQ